MSTKLFLILGAAVLCLIGVYGSVIAMQKQDPSVRLAELEIDPAQLAAYQAALKEEIETSIRVEPGVLTLYAVAEKDNPVRIRVFEIYADEQAYRKHLETPHFKKYKATTQAMVKSLKLIEATPVMLGTKTR